MKNLPYLLTIVLLASCVNNNRDLELIVLPSPPAYKISGKFRDFGYYEVTEIMEVNRKKFEEDKANAKFIEKKNDTIYYSMESAMEIESPKDNMKEWVPVLERYKVKKQKK